MEEQTHLIQTQAVAAYVFGLENRWCATANERYKIPEIRLFNSLHQTDLESFLYINNIFISYKLPSLCEFR